MITLSCKSAIRPNPWHLVIFVFLTASCALASDCHEIAALPLDHTTITTAKSVAGGTFTPEQGSPITGLPDFCRITASVHPLDDSDIKVEMWLPESGWNGRMEGTGNGGLAGKIAYGALAAGLKSGYAVVNTDMGLAVPSGSGAGIFVGRPERWADWGWRATHEMTVLGKQLIHAYYGNEAKKSYFVGCSTGGEQALMEAQRFPDDYDGIVGGAPAHNRTGVHISILWNFAATQNGPGAYLPPAKISLLTDSVVRSCDALDGVRDGLISDPRRCNFHPESLQCKAGDGPGCLSAAQVATAKAIYTGPVDPRTHRQIYPGLPLGSESGWAGFGPAPAVGTKAPYAPVFQWAFGEDWNWKDFDFGRDVDTLDQQLASTLNALNPNLDAFRRHGHKLLLYHGWSDWLVAPQETIRYYDAVVARDKDIGLSHSSAVQDKRIPDQQSLDRSVRLFMVPGMAHCGGGPGPGSIDPLSAVIRWTEDGVAPDQLVATRSPAEMQPGTEPQRRLLCPYPLEAQYRSTGDKDDVTAYTCVKLQRETPATR